MADPWLVMCDVDGVQAWLLRSVHLREIAGASHLLVDHDDNLGAVASGGEVLFAKGGTALVRFDDKEPAIRFCAEVPNALERTTVNATLTVSDPVSVGARGFGGAIATLVQDVERKKRQGHARGEVLDFCHAARCQGCALEPAVDQGRVRIGSDDRLLGAACLARHGVRDRAWWLAWMRGRPGWERSRSRLPADANELAGNGKLALLLADANGVGERLAALDTEEDYRKFSSGLAGALREALIEAIAREAPPGRWNRDTLPVEVLYAGGDDLLIACQGDLALPLASTLTNEFAARAGKEAGWTGGDSLGISFGITIASSKFPFRVSHAIATGLLRHAKRAARAEGWAEGAVDWAIVTEAWSSADAILSDRAVETSAAALLLTGRPYRTAERGERSLASFRRACSEVAAGVPRNKLFDLRRSCSAAELLRDGARTPAEAKNLLDSSIQELVRRLRRDPDVERRWSATIDVLGLDASCFWASGASQRTPIGDLADGLELWGLR